jgi:DNA-binding transcriptional LysR family regulator
MRRLIIHHLEAFRAIMLSGTTTGAATALAVSQPSISRLLGELEGQLGVQLFVRQKGRLIPTQEAEWLFNEAQDVLTRLDRLDTSARDVRHFSIGELRIVATPPLAHGLVPECLRRLRSVYPDLRVTLQVAFRREVRMVTDSQNFDVALSTLPIDYPAPESERLVSVRGVCILPTGHHLTEKTVIEAADLAEEPFISPLPEALSRMRLDLLFDEAGVRRKRQLMESHTPMTICQMVAAGLGVAVTDPFTARAFAHLGIAIRSFAPTFEYEYGLLFPLRRPRSRLAKEFAEAAHACVAEYLQSDTEMIESTGASQV